MEYVADDGSVLSDDALDRMAEEYERGSWSGRSELTPGRPRMYDEDMQTVSFRLPKSRIEAIDALTKQTGESKSQFFRKAVDDALLAYA